MNRLFRNRAVLAAGLGLLFAGVLAFVVQSPPPPETASNNGWEWIELDEPAVSATGGASPRAARPPAKFIDPIAAQPAAGPVRTEPPTDEELRAFGKSLKNAIETYQARAAARGDAPMDGIPRGFGPRVPNPDQQKAIDETLDRIGGDPVLHMDNVSGTLRHLEGDLENLVRNSPAYIDAADRGDYGAMALALADELGGVLNLRDPGSELAPGDVKGDELGMTHVTLQQYADGMPVWGAQLGVHFSKDGDPFMVSGVYSRTPADLPPPTVEIDAQTAIANAKAALGMTNDSLVPPRAEAMMYWDIDKVPAPCWRVELTPTFYQSWYVFVSLRTGGVVHRSNRVCLAAVTGSSPDLFGRPQEFSVWQEGAEYFMFDTSIPWLFDPTSKPPRYQETRGAVIIYDLKGAVLGQGVQFSYLSSPNPAQWDPAGVSVLENYHQVADYYWNTFQRKSIDGNGMNIEAAVHAKFPNGQGGGTGDNAIWQPAMQMMFFGDGGQLFDNFAKALDVTGHELTHGVINHSADLIYENQPGALNEHIADFFGTMVDRDDWLQGEDITLGGKIATRDMQNPGNPDILAPQPEKMSEYRNLPNTSDGDWGGVHVNSGIPNRMSYLMAEGPNGIGKEKTERIIYRALTNYLKQRSQFIDYRRFCIQAAADLYGDGPETAAVRAAFDGVEITDQGTGGQPLPDPVDPTPAEPVQGDDFTVFLAGDARFYDQQFDQSGAYQLGLRNSQGSFLVTERLVSRTRPAVSGNGQVILYVDVQNNLYITDGETDELINVAVDGQRIPVRTIAWSKDGRYVALTSAVTVQLPQRLAAFPNLRLFENAIYLFDLQQETIRRFEVLVPDTQSGTTALDYADILTFNFQGDTLYYDAVVFNVIQSESGGQPALIGEWGVYGMRVVDGVSQQFLPTVPGKQFGNPLMANTSDHQLVADFIEEPQPGNLLFDALTIDFLNRKINIMPVDVSMDSQPSYTGDDGSMIFRLRNPAAAGHVLAQAQLTPDQTGFAGELTPLFEWDVDLAYPVGFRVGEYTDHKGSISIPPALAFGPVPAGERQIQELTVANNGNADLQVINIGIEGANAASFSHNGINQVIPAGRSISFNVAFAPAAAGPQTALLNVESTDLANPRAQVQLSGEGLPSAVPTPTSTPILAQPTATPPPLFPSPTPFGPPVPTPTVPPAGGEVEPLMVYEFNEATLDATGWAEIPGGFQGNAPGTVGPTGFFGDPVPSSADKRGLAINAANGQVVFIYAKEPVNTGGAPLLLRAVARADGTGAALYLGALKGPIGATDGSIGLISPSNSASFVDGENGLAMLYEPDAGELATPLFQVAHSGNGGPVGILLDRIEVYLIDANRQYPADFFKALKR